MSEKEDALTDALIAAAERLFGVRLVCRRCGMEASLPFIRALLNDSVNGVAQCFCEGVEWDYA